MAATLVVTSPHLSRRLRIFLLTLAVANNLMVVAIVAVTEETHRGPLPLPLALITLYAVLM